jgi:dienelactone hydrolase
MLQAFFHAWERRLADVTKDRVVRPFEWGLDWIACDDLASQWAAAPSGPPPARGGAARDAFANVSDWVEAIMANTDAFYTPRPTSAYLLDAPGPEGDQLLQFPTAYETPHPANNTVYCRLFRPKRDAAGAHRAAVLVLPQWNADAGGHVGLCKLLAMSGMTALRLSLPYHDRRMPLELHRADYIVSANVARTVQVCRQAVLDARRAIHWLHAQGYDRIGILGTSLGSCLSLLTTAHEPLIDAQALNHISPYFADVVWRGLSTRHVREGLKGHLNIDQLRELWKPISPQWYLDRLHGRQTLLVYARYDLTFPVDLSQDLIEEFRRRQIPHEVAVLRCGHYSTGKTPFKFVDGWILTRFLKKALLGRVSRPTAARSAPPHPAPSSGSGSQASSAGRSV